MKRLEVLSPAGDIATFKECIYAGCDAIYLGLPKFNARMRAENITLENLPNLIKFAHLKDVKVYITLNTILTDKEIKEAVDLCKEAWDMGVDAFIVQDLGLISEIKKNYPDIILHGSTQMGVHNIHGAQVAKDLGLSRVVLSRECTLADIRAIRENVDIELEVFVQGANCISFSGNCYLSSIKCGASGNRGECKQLCRLPYTLSDGQKSLSGYVLSPRENCMLEYIDELKYYVTSIKIEGRLRQIGYVKIATSIYRKMVDYVYNDDTNNCRDNARNIDMNSTCNNVEYDNDDKIKDIKCVENKDKKSISNASIINKENINKEDIDKYNINNVSISNLKSDLARVFSRGDFVCGYNGGNDIVEASTNNHLGVKIGVVESVTKFKDLYKVKISISHNPHADISDKVIVSGDGIKFKTKNDIITAGVGNVEYNDNNIILYVKNMAEIGSYVYLSKDTQFENAVPNLSRYRIIDIYARIIAGEKIHVKFSCENEECEYVGDVVDKAEKRAITSDNIISQLSKIDSEIYTISKCEIYTQDAFLPLSALNEIRRQLISEIENKLLEKSLSSRILSQSSSSMRTGKVSTKVCENFQDLDKFAIVDEECDISNLASLYDGLIFSPTLYSIEAIEKFEKEYIKFFKTPLIINLPTIARVQDIEIIDSIVSKFNYAIFIANNIYGLSYLGKVRIWAGAGFNIVNEKSYNLLKNLGVEKIIASFEKWTNRLGDTYKISNFPLMTLTSCPVKTLYRCSCDKCKYSKSMTISGNNCKMFVRRIKISNCYFELFEKNPNVKNCNIVDMRL